MRAVIPIVLLLAVALPVFAHDLGSARPPKPVAQTVPPPPDPAVLRQGGDTIADAVEITLDHIGSGTTTGYTDDYDEACPYTGSTSPDVVYTVMHSLAHQVDIDLYGSSYDTKVYLYDESLDLVACNDDFYADYTSMIEHVTLAADVRYYIVIDGYGGAFGEYQLQIRVNTYGVDCPPWAQLEGEPELVDGYIDEHNGGCNSLDDIGYAPFQQITNQHFCGVSGWYLNGESYSRDTDWFTVTLPVTGTLTIEAEAYCLSRMSELGPQDCDAVGVLQSVEIRRFELNQMTVTGEPGSEVWIWVAPVAMEPPGTWHDYTYLLFLDNPVAVEDRSWSNVKSLFR